LRQDYAEFGKRNTEVLAMGPDGPNAFRKYWAENDMPFIGMADIKSRVADTYYQEIKLLKFGRMPAIFVIDLQGIIRYVHYGDNMADIPTDEEVFAVLDDINKKS
jgi:peroxiredoxin